MFRNLAVEGEGHAVRIACGVGGVELADLHAGPVIRPLHKGARRVETQKRDGKPDAVQHRKGLLQRDSRFRFNHFRLAAVRSRHGIAPVNQIEIEA